MMLNNLQALQMPPAVLISCVLLLAGLFILFVFAISVIWASLWIDVIVPMVDAYIFQDDDAQTRPMAEAEDVAQCRAVYWSCNARTGIYFM